MVNGQWVALGSHPSLGLNLLPQNLDVAIVSWCFMTSSSASKARQRRRTIPKGPMTAEIVFRRQRIVIFGKLGIIMCIYIYICNYDVHYIFCLGLLEFAMKSMCCHGPPAGCLQKAPCPLSSVWEAQVLIRNGGYPKITSLVGKKMIDHRIFIGT